MNELDEIIKQAWNKGDNIQMIIGTVLLILLFAAFVLKIVDLTIRIISIYGKI